MTLEHILDIAYHMRLCLSMMSLFSSGGSGTTVASIRGGGRAKVGGDSFRGHGVCFGVDVSVTSWRRSCKQRWR